MTKLFIGGFPLDMTELEVVQLVAFHAEVRTIKIVRDKKTKICKGYAFLELADLAGAEQAIEALDGKKVDGRKLRLNIVPDDLPATAPVTAKPKKPRINTQTFRRL